MQVEVIEVTDKGIHSHPVTLHVGASALEAIEAAGLVLGENDAISLWGRKVKTDATLSEGDRVEFARALVCDPKKVRQEHALAQGDTEDDVASHNQKTANKPVNAYSKAQDTIFFAQGG